MNHADSYVILQCLLVLLLLLFALRLSRLVKHIDIASKKTSEELGHWMWHSLEPQLQYHIDWNLPPTKSKQVSICGCVNVCVYVCVSVHTDMNAPTIPQTPPQKASTAKTETGDISNDLPKSLGSST
jgi:hypothetical protein